jgi:hypothetical protein
MWKWSLWKTSFYIPPCQTSVHNSCPGLSEASCGTDAFRNANSSRVEAQSEMEQHLHCYVLAVHETLTTKEHSSFPLHKEHTETGSEYKSLHCQNLIRHCHSQQVTHNGWVVNWPCLHPYNYYEFQILLVSFSLCICVCACVFVCVCVCVCVCVYNENAVPLSCKGCMLIGSRAVSN